MKENKALVCSECGERIEEYCGRYFCAKCGREYNKVIDDVGNKIFKPVILENKDEQSKLIEEKENRTMRITVIACIFVVCVLIIYGLNTTPLSNNFSQATGHNNYENGTTMSQQNQQKDKKFEAVSKSIDRFANINVDEKGEKYFDIKYKDFLSNYNYFVTAEYGEIASNYTIMGVDAATYEGSYTSNYGREITRHSFPSMISGQRVYVDGFSNYINSVIWKIDNDLYNNMSVNEKDIIRKQIEFVSMALLPEIDESFYENQIWSVLRKSIIDNKETAIAVVGKVCFYTYNSEDNKRCIYIYPKKDLTYQPSETEIPLEKAIIGKWQNADGSIWEYKTNGTFTIDFSTYRPEDKSKEADILRKQDIIVIPYSVNGDNILFKMGKVQYNNDVRIKNGFKYEISSVGKTQATMKKVE